MDDGLFEDDGDSSSADDDGQILGEAAGHVLDGILATQ